MKEIINKIFNRLLGLLRFLAEIILTTALGLVIVSSIIVLLTIFIRGVWKEAIFEGGLIFTVVCAIIMFVLLGRTRDKREL